jgi:hypothetical protein
MILPDRFVPFGLRRPLGFRCRKPDAKFFSLKLGSIRIFDHGIGTRFFCYFYKSIGLRFFRELIAHDLDDADLAEAA